MAAIASTRDPLYHGMMAEFHDADEVLRAAQKVRAAGYTHLDGYTPFPVHGLDEAIGFKDSKVQWSIFFAGLVGFFGGYGMEVWVNMIEYPMNVGGRPKLSWPSFIPVAYECSILLAGLTAAFSMLAFNGLPRPNHPVFNTPNFELASQTSFFLCVEGTDPKFDHAEVKNLLESVGAVNVSDCYADEPEDAE